MGNKNNKTKNINKEENKEEKKMENNVGNKFDSNPLSIHFLKDLIIDSYCRYWCDNTFSLFKSYNDIFYIIYTNSSKSIISFDIINNKKISEIKHAHNDYITNLRYYFDKENKRDLLISLSEDDNNLKLWNINNLECLLNIIKVNKYGWLSSAYFLNDNNNNYIITNNKKEDSNTIIENIKIFDFNGNVIKRINNSNYSTIFIDTYYDNNLSKIFIITGNEGFNQSYDYNENKQYFKYCDNPKEINRHMCLRIDDTEKIIKMIESSCAGVIRIWDFHSAKLLNKIDINNEWLYSICLWNEEYLFVGCKDSSIKLIKLSESKIIKNLTGHTNKVLTIKKIKLPKYGECLISQDADYSQIKLWKISM